MSYLTLPGGIPSFTKAVISFWFRVPQASIDAATATTSAYRDVPPLFNGIIPLVVMGQTGFYNPFDSVVSTITLPDGHGDLTVTTTTPTGERLPTDPFVIGINCDPSFDRPVLYMNFETNQRASVSDYYFELRNFTPPSTFTYVNATDVVTNSTASINGTNIFLGRSGSVADKWHHLLISLDFPTISARGVPEGEPNTGKIADYVDSWAQLFVALDDVNYTGFDLSNYFTNHPTNLNAVIPQLALQIAGWPQPIGFIGTFPITGPIGGVPQYTLSNPSIPCDGQPMGLPAPAVFENNVHHVEMAEFQMFTGITLDTSVEENRRAFIDEKGKPVPADQKQTKDAESGSIEFLGKKPEVMLHGQGNWIKGANTGTTGIDKNGDKIPGGQFKPTAKIKKYNPNPQLGK